MSKFKPKQIRLIDILGIMNDNDMVVVMFKNQSKTTHSNYVRVIRTILDEYLGCTVEGIIGGGGLTVLIND